MTATQARPKRRKMVKTAGRPVQEVLLELAYRLHATRVIGRRPDPRRA